MSAIFGNINLVENNKAVKLTSIKFYSFSSTAICEVKI